MKKKSEYLFVKIGKGKNALRFVQINNEYWVNSRSFTWINFISYGGSFRTFEGERGIFLNVDKLIVDCPEWKNVLGDAVERINKECKELVK